MVNSERPNMKIVTPETAQKLIFMMSEVTKNGTGIRAKFSDWGSGWQNWYITISA